MSQRAQITMCCVCRKRHPYVLSDTDGADELWLFAVTGPLGTDVIPQRLLDGARDASAIAELRDRLKDAWAETLAGDIEETVWKIDGPSDERQMTSLVASLPDSATTLVQDQLAGLARDTSIPAPVASLGAGVTATLVLSPVLKPAEEVLHSLEVVGIVLGLVTGLHPLVIVCAKHLAYDEFGSALTRTIKHATEGSTLATVSGLDSQDRPKTIEGTGSAFLSSEGTELVHKATGLADGTLDPGDGLAASATAAAEPLEDLSVLPSLSTL